MEPKLPFFRVVKSTIGDMFDRSVDRALWGVKERDRYVDQVNTGKEFLKINSVVLLYIYWVFQKKGGLRISNS